MFQNYFKIQDNETVILSDHGSRLGGSDWF